MRSVRFYRLASGQLEDQSVTELRKALTERPLVFHRVPKKTASRRSTSSEGGLRQVSGELESVQASGEKIDAFARFSFDEHLSSVDVESRAIQAVRSRNRVHLWIYPRHGLVAILDLPYRIVGTTIVRGVSHRLKEQGLTGQPIDREWPFVENVGLSANGSSAKPFSAKLTELGLGRLVWNGTPFRDARYVLSDGNARDVTKSLRKGSEELRSIGFQLTLDGSRPPLNCKAFASRTVVVYSPDVSGVEMESLVDWLAPRSVSA